MTKNPDKPIDDVFLTGDGALIRGIEGLFKIQLNIQTRIMDSLYNVKFDPKIDLKIYNPVYLIAPIGAAFAPMGFRPTEIKAAKSGNSDYVKYFAIIAGVVVVAGVAASAISYMAKNNAQQQRDDLNRQILAIQDVEQVITEYEAAQAKYDDIALMYDQTKTLNENVVMFIEALEQNQPKDMIVNDFASDEEGVKLTGTSRTDESIAKLIVQLKKVECVSDVFVTQYERKEEEGNVWYEFAFQCNFVSMDALADAEGETSETTTEAE